MKRWLTKRIILSLILGALTTFAVAWGCAYWIDVHKGRITVVALPIPKPATYSFYRARAIGAERIYLIVWSYPNEARPDSRDDEAFLPAWVPWDLSQVPTGDEKSPLMCADARGWPWPALWCEAITPDYNTPAKFKISGGGIACGEQETAISPFGIITANARVFPLRPLWPGFVYNTAISTAAWFVLLLPLGLRRTLRRRRNQCTRCGYSLQGIEHTNTCPECGWNRTSVTTKNHGDQHA